MDAGSTEQLHALSRLRRRLAAHKRRMRYWSGLPSFSGFGPSSQKLKRGYMSQQYELACCDALSIAQEIEKQGASARVVDLRETFRARFTNPKSPEVLLWPNQG